MRLCPQLHRVCFIPHDYLHRPLLSLLITMRTTVIGRVWRPSFATASSIIRIGIGHQPCLTTPEQHHPLIKLGSCIPRHAFGRSGNLPHFRTCLLQQINLRPDFDSPLRRCRTGTRMGGADGLVALAVDIDTEWLPSVGFRRVECGGLPNRSAALRRCIDR